MRATAQMSTRATTLSGVMKSFPPDLYFRQLTPGVEIATSDDPIQSLARQMNNFIYLVGDRFAYILS